MTSGSLCSVGSNAMSSQVGSTCRSVRRASGRKSPVPAACSMSKSIPPEADLIGNRRQRQSRCVDDGGQPGPHPPHATLVAQRHQARECGARPRKGRAQDEAADAAVDGGGQQHVPGRATTQILLRWHAPRQARDVGSCASKADALGHPADHVTRRHWQSLVGWRHPLEDAVGDHTDGVKQPAVTDGGAQADGRGHDVGGSHQCGVPRWVVEQTLGF